MSPGLRSSAGCRAPPPSWYRETRHRARAGGQCFAASSAAGWLPDPCPGPSQRAESPACGARRGGCPKPGTAAVPRAVPGTPGEDGAAWAEEAAEPRHQGPSTQGSGWGNSDVQPERGDGTCGARLRPGSAEHAAAVADLVLESWDLQCERNGREHRTAKLGCRQLVVRRGQPFAVTLHFSGRSYEEGVDKLAFNVETGECRRALRCSQRRAARAALTPALCPGARPIPPRQSLVLCTALIPRWREKVETAP